MRKVFSFIITILGIIAIMFTLSFLYIKGYFDGLINIITGNNNTQVVNSPNPSGMKYISERSFSMRFRSDKNEVGFGTGWLFAKDESVGNNDLTYYVATNLHVASFIKNSNSNRSYYAYDEVSKKYVLKNPTNFNAIDIGQVGTWEGKTFIPGTEKAQLWSEVKYYEYLNLSSNVSISPVTIAYETFDMFKNKNIVNKDHIYNENNIQNGTLDLAILKMDFSKVKQTKLLDNSILNKSSPIKDTLKLFDQSPTKFANDFNPKNDVISVGGFPATQNNLYGATSYWNSASNTSLYRTQDGATALSNANWNDGITEVDMSKVKKNYSLKNQINYLTNEYASYLNVGSQNLFYNMDLTGGSSGSMAINQNNEVIGIYWGTYSFSNGTSYGVVDSFKNSKETNNIVAYNVYDDFIKKIPTSSLSKTITN